MTVKMGALEGVFDVFVLFRAGSRSPLHALMSWCGFWCWPSNLLWCSGPGVHPSILPLSRTQMHPLHTQSTSHAGGCSLIYIASRKQAAPLSCSALLLMKRRRMCTYVCFVCLYERGRGGDGIHEKSMCKHVHVYMYAGRHWYIGGNASCKSPNNENVFFLSSTCLYYPRDYFPFFPSVFFPQSFAKSPPKKPIFVQAASEAFQMHNYFPLWALLFPGMLISCDDQRDTGIKVLCFKHFVVFMLLP